MLQHIRRAFRGRRADDSGIAMILVMGYGMVLVLGMGLLAGYALDSMKGARREQDYYSAIEAAQAGVDEVIAGFNASAAAAGATASWSGWLAVPGATDADGAACAAIAPAVTCPQYRYRIEADPTSARPGAVVIRAVGKSRQVQRAIKVSVQPRSFGDYLYYSDVEAFDPSDDLVPGLVGTLLTYHRENCAVRAWDSPRPADCNQPQFRTGDKLSGARVHSNDAFLINGAPRFDAPVSTAFPACASRITDADCYRVPSGATASPAGLPSGITYDPSFAMPSDAAVLDAVKNDPDTCVYTGPTRIDFVDGRMNVWSPQTPAGQQTASGLNCGGGPTLGGDLNNLVNLDLFATAKSVESIPEAIFVQPAPPTTNPLGCRLNQLLGLTAGGILDINLNDGCTAGTLMVSGRLDGKTTAAAADDIIIVDDLTYRAPAPAGDDMLGLIARNNVEAYNPLQCTLALQTGCLRNGVISGALNLTNYLLGSEPLKIDAAIVALNGRFGVQLSNLIPTLPLTGLKPKLMLRGSVAQKYAGYVGGPLSLNVAGLNSANPIDLALLPTGFEKDYVYDESLRTELPLHFPIPINAPFERRAFAETDVPDIP